MVRMAQPPDQHQSQPGPGNPYADPYAKPPTAPTRGSSFGTWQHQAQPQTHPKPDRSPQQTLPPQRFADANPLRAAFDFRFNSYATPGLVKIIYVLAAIIAGLWWIGGGLTALIAGIAAVHYSGKYGMRVLAVLGLLLGWIPSLLWLLFVRIILEASLALVRIADDVRNIRTAIGR